MSTLRQYINPTIIEQITGVTITDERLIAVAESQIDSYAQEKLNFLYFQDHKSVNIETEYSSAAVSLTATTMTITGNSYPVNQFQFGIIELLADAGTVKKGTKLAVIQSNNNVLTFDSVPALNGLTAPVKIYQLGLFPRIKDTRNYGKTIPTQITEAVAWQSAHLFGLGATVNDSVKASNSKSKVESESIGSSYSYTLKNMTNSSDAVCIQSQALIDSL